MDVEIGPCGLIKPDILYRVDSFLIKVKRSPAKPQQKLWILKNRVYGHFLLNCYFTTKQLIL